MTFRRPRVSLTAVARLLSDDQRMSARPRCNGCGDVPVWRVSFTYDGMTRLQIEQCDRCREIFGRAFAYPEYAQLAEHLVSLFAYVEERCAGAPPPELIRLREWLGRRDLAEALDSIGPSADTLAAEQVEVIRACRGDFEGGLRVTPTTAPGRVCRVCSSRTDNMYRVVIGSPPMLAFVICEDHRLVMIEELKQAG